MYLEIVYLFYLLAAICMYLLLCRAGSRSFIKPDCIDLNSNDKFKAYIELPTPYSVDAIVIDTIVCEGAHAISGTIDEYGRFVATFNIQDLKLGPNYKRRMKFTVSGELGVSIRFEGIGTVRIKGKTWQTITKYQRRHQTIVSGMGG